jgi:2'-5' RNA ligase
MPELPETTRSFIAIAVPEPLDRALAALQAELSSEVADCRWTSSLPFHTTLAFLGNVATRKLDKLCSTVAASAASFEPFELHLEGVGAFPSATRPCVLWAGLTASDREAFLALRASIVQAVERVGHRIEDQRFHPHVTLGRMKPGHRAAQDLTALVERHHRWFGGAFTVSEIVTFSSALRRTGSIYTAIGRAPIGSKKTEAPP